MSFKREGDDRCLLQNLNNHRVKELLSNHIPQDEAKLLSNGRLTCLICIHRPIFDTINMLSVHRKGKRHLFELSKHIKCKEDKEIRLVQEKKLYYRGDPSSAPKSLMLGSRHASNKASATITKRKHILEIKPIPKRKTMDDSKNHNSDGSTVVAPVKQYLKQMSRKSSLEKVVERNRENYGIDLKKEEKNKNDDTTLVKILPQTKEDFGSKTAAPNRNESQEYEMRLRMSGWIKDTSGKWIKDPNVEFDSDDDDIPPPPT